LAICFKVTSYLHCILCVPLFFPRPSRGEVAVSCPGVSLTPPPIFLPSHYIRPFPPAVCGSLKVLSFVSARRVGLDDFSPSPTPLRRSVCRQGLSAIKSPSVTSFFLLFFPPEPFFAQLTPLVSFPAVNRPTDHKKRPVPPDNPLTHKTCLRPQRPFPR